MSVAFFEFCAESSGQMHLIGFGREVLVLKNPLVVSLHNENVLFI